ncbi:hypothetical protein DEJ48_18980 [Streptomyces venezuelae]|uniref:Gram-positive cocci surface proteins LPxTG domain-containing protein n=1 Tax=Streptomyces venezuelae TaxID=54571 RepID=A0A5P2C1Q4_STRVZ|nr:hypothetical protein [Streptomyces venezuelae]QES35221.1 hypothetical protein DEJ48_18980 [Streptomyces venezuelae]
MRATRRTFRTAAIATGAIAALAVPTTAAFAADAPSTPQGQVAQDDQQGTQDQTGKDEPGKDQDNNKKQDDNQDKSKDDQDRTDKDQTDKDKDKDKEQPPVPGGWESKGTTNLGKGWTASVEVNASARTAKATISLNGAAKGSLTAYEKSASTTIDGNTFTLTPDGTATAKLTDKDKDPVVGGWESKGTTDLGKGWTAKVDVNASARTAKAAISLNGKPKGSLTAYDKSATTKIDGNTFTLTSSGTITMKAGPKPEPKPDPKPDHKRVFVREYKNLGGSGFDAKVYKVKGGYEADMIAKAPDTGRKTVWDTLKQSGDKPAYGQHNGAHFVLNPDGTMKGWTEGRTNGNGHHDNHGTKPKPQPHPRNDSQQVVPKGGVKAGADGVQSESSSDDAPLIAAGSGMAAAGAAGLGFALYRRKQNG